MAVLVVGGAGYVGSHAVRQLLDRNEEVIVIDNLETGHRKAVPGECTFFREIFGIASFRKGFWIRFHSSSDAFCR